MRGAAVRFAHFELLNTMAERSLNFPPGSQPERFPPVLVMYHPSMRKLAENLVKRVQTLALNQVQYNQTA